MNTQLGTEDKDYVVTSDTDSLFIQVKDLVLQRYPETKTKDEYIKATLEITTEIQKAANDTVINSQTRLEIERMKAEIAMLLATMHKNSLGNASG